MFAAAVERWRISARKWAAWASALYHAPLDESDVLALISIESAGRPDVVSRTGYRGLGQVGAAAVADYNAAVPDSMTVDLEWMDDPSHADEQVRVVAWHMARGRDLVAAWPMPDARANAARWADARYSWGGGNLRSARKRYIAAHGIEPTFPQLAVAEPDAGKPNVRPWHHADRVVQLAESDRATGPGATPAEPQKKN